MANRSSTNANWDTIKADLRKYANSVCRNAASEIADELTEDALFAMGAFYSDYSPKKYSRHYYNFMNKSFRRYYSNPHNKIFRGGVEYTPNLMDSIYSNNPVEDVFVDVVGMGSHGPYGLSKVPLMDKSPMQMVIEDRDNIVKNINSYIDRAKVKAQKDNYSVLTFNR